MPSRNLFHSVCGDLLDTGGGEQDIVSFCTNQVWGLGYTLRPVQQFLLKAIYGLPLDTREKRIEIPDLFREKIIRVATEEEYFHYLRDSGRISCKHWPEGRCQEVVLVMGRRGTKTSSVSMIAAYETYRLLRRPSPQEFYGVLDADDIRITNVANSEEQAAKLFKIVRGHFNRSGFFKPFMAGNSDTHVSLRSQSDMDKYGSECLPCVKVVCAGCNARAIRGGANIIVVMDEMAHFLNNGGQKSDSEIYDALTPSVGDFGGDGLILNLSSPLNKGGRFYELYMQGMQSDGDLLVLQIPSSEANPALTSTFLKTRYRRDPDVFMREYGAQFSESSKAYVEDQEKLKMVVSDRPYIHRGSTRSYYFMGIDLGLVNDGTGISIGHVEWLPSGVGEENRVKVVHDLTEGLYAGIDPFEASDQLLLDDVVERVAKLCVDFPILAGVIDQWCGPPMEQALKKKGLKQFELVNFTRTLNSEIYTTLKTLYLAEQVDIAGGWDSPLVQEMLTLDKKVLPGFLIKVECPQLAGYHDDLSDSFARMVWVAFKKSLGGGVKVVSGSYGATQTAIGGRVRRRMEQRYAGRSIPRSSSNLVRPFR